MHANIILKITRRSILAATAAGLTSPAQVAENPFVDPRSFRIPGEFEPQRAIWLGYDINLEDTTLELAEALGPQTPLNFLVNDEAAAERVRALMGRRSGAKAALHIHVEPLAMFYPRDAAVFATSGGQRLGVIDFRWNQYGLPEWCRRRYAGSAARQAQCAAGAEPSRDRLDKAIARLAGAQAMPSELVMEGGAVESNGQGLVIACEAQVRSRNPGLSRAELERHYLRLPGVRRVIWLPEGLAQDPHLRASIVGPYVGFGTGGHTDEFVRFADANTVLLAWPDEQDAKRHAVARMNLQRMQRNAAVLAAVRTPSGQALRVLRVPLPRMVERPRVLSATADRDRFDEWTADFFPAREGRREGDTVIQVATTSYLNFVIGNGVLVLPDYLPHGTPPATQARVEAVFRAAFPGREIRWVDAISLNWLGGGLHCATLHEPLLA